MNHRPDEIREILENMREIELEILRHRCAGKNYQDIMVDAGVSRSLVNRTIRNLWVRLGIDNEEKFVRDGYLTSAVCPVLEQMNKESMEEFTEPFPDEDEEHSPPKDYSEIEESLDQSKPQSPGTSQAQPRDLSRILQIAGLVLIGLIGVAIVIWIANLVNPQIGQTFPTITPRDEGSQQENTTSTEIEPTSTQKQEAVVDPSTEAPTQLPGQEGSLEQSRQVFSDDFLPEPDPSWNLHYGELGMVNKYFTVNTISENKFTEHLAILDNYVWDDITITLNVKKICSNVYGAVVIRYNEDGNSLGFLYNSPNGVRLAYLTPEGDWISINSTVRSTGYNFCISEHLIVIRVIDDNYIVEMNDIEFIRINLEGFESGKVGLWFKSDVHATDADKIAPRIEFISVESLP